ncbi:MAG: polysaccharide deacetylase family protein [Alphaproteobacteria bacterium]
MASDAPSPATGAATANWPELIAEFDRWSKAGRIAELWWRDDDAVAATPELAELLRIAGGAPIALAAIPSLASESLAPALRDAPSAMVLQHGWRHVNRAVSGKKSEYPSGLAGSIVAAELGAGRSRLAALFGDRALPVFVPPWNRCAPELLGVLPEAGMAAFSSIAPLPEATTGQAGLRLIPVHVDLTNWKGGRLFIGEASALGSLVDALRRCRFGSVASAGPIGILTHHLIMDRATAGFLERLLELIAGHRAARWVAVSEMLR